MLIFERLGKFFGGKKRDKPQSTGEAIQSLRETEKMLEEKNDFLEKQIENQLVVARKNAKTNKGFKKLMIVRHSIRGILDIKLKMQRSHRVDQKTCPLLRL